VTNDSVTKEAPGGLPVTFVTTSCDCGYFPAFPAGFQSPDMVEKQLRKVQRIPPQFKADCDVGHFTDDGEAEGPFCANLEKKSASLRN
jgi:hypothetical protein